MDHDVGGSLNFMCIMVIGSGYEVGCQRNEELLLDKEGLA